MRKILLTVALGLSTLPLPAWAQEPAENCAPIDQVAAYLAAEHRETRVQQGVTQGGQTMLVIFAAPDGGTWTAVMVRADGLACLAAAGSDWQTRSDPAPEAEEGL